MAQSRARFDIDGDGRRQLLAWVGPDDDLLVYDRDGDRRISHRDEIAFVDYLENAKTDLEGLAWFDQIAQGGNEDGVLDARDAKWPGFGVWRDANQDGVSDPGELSMTGEGDGGLSSVNLKSDQIRRDLGPDAKSFGRGEFTKRDADGRTRPGDLWDTALRYAEEAKEKPRKKSRAEILYPSEPEPQPEPEPEAPREKHYRRRRRDGQPMSRAEILYPEGYPPEDYHMVQYIS